MGTVGICSASAPGLPAGFKQQAVIATDTGRLAGEQGTMGEGVPVWKVLTTLWDGSFWKEVSLFLRCLEVRMDST